MTSFPAFGILALLSTAGKFAFSAPLAAETVRLTLLGVGDICNFGEDYGRGGFARLNAAAKVERAANPDRLYLPDGGMLSPSLQSGFDQGADTIAFTNLVPFDLAVPGNHEFDSGPEVFLRMAEAKYPWAAINITNADGSSAEELGGVMVREVGGLRMALIPVTRDILPEVSSTGSLKFLPTVETGIAAAKKAREDGADIVVGVVQT